MVQDRQAQLVDHFADPLGTFSCWSVNYIALVTKKDGLGEGAKAA